MARAFSCEIGRTVDVLACQEALISLLPQTMSPQTMWLPGFIVVDFYDLDARMVPACRTVRRSEGLLDRSLR